MSYGLALDASFWGRNRIFMGRNDYEYLNFKKSNNIFTYTPSTTFSTKSNLKVTDYSLGFNFKPSEYEFKATPQITKTPTRFSPNLNKEFLEKTKQVAKNLNCEYKDLLAMMNSESGLKAHIARRTKSGKITAVGLIQFTKPAIQELKRVYGIDVTLEQIEKMPAIEQLDLVEKYLTVAKKYCYKKDAKLSAGDLYAITFLPGRAKRHVLCAKGDGDSFYESNRGLDRSKNGQITKTDLANHLAYKQVDEALIA